jgi:hypothetical protein
VLVPAGHCQGALQLAPEKDTPDLIQRYLGTSFLVLIGFMG